MNKYTYIHSFYFLIKYFALSASEDSMVLLLLYQELLLYQGFHEKMFSTIYKKGGTIFFFFPTSFPQMLFFQSVTNRDLSKYSQKSGSSVPPLHMVLSFVDSGFQYFSGYFCKVWIVS